MGDFNQTQEMTNDQLTLLEIIQDLQSDVDQLKTFADQKGDGPLDDLGGGGGLTSGSFELKFHEDKAFQLFGREYSRVYADLRVRGALKKPFPSGPLSYTIEFNLALTCQNVLKDFSIAYRKAFSNDSAEDLPIESDWGMEGTAEDFPVESHDLLETPDYTARLLSCGTGLDKTDPFVTIGRANGFFKEGLFSIQTTVDGEELLTPPLMNGKDGLVQFIVGKQVAEDPKVNLKIQELYKVLLGMVNICTNYIQQQVVAKNDPALLHNRDLWEKAINHLPLLSVGSFTEATESVETGKVGVATSFIKMLMEIAITPEFPEAAFADFLEAQGKEISIGFSRDKQTYDTLTVGITIEVKSKGEVIIYVPKIKLYHVNFDQKNIEITSACTNVSKDEMSFRSQNLVAAFDYFSFEEPGIKKQLDAFLDSRQKAEIQKSKSFFGASVKMKS